MEIDQAGDLDRHGIGACASWKRENH
jgi:hypothetical protein